MSRLPRAKKIGTLIDLLPALHPAARTAALDLLAAFLPIEACPRLAAMLRQNPDPQTAVKLLQTLRSATLITSSSSHIDLDQPALAHAFELIQQTFNAELSRLDGDPDRFREAVSAIPDVFPGELALTHFQALADAFADAQANARDFPLTGPELFGQWLETAVGIPDRRDFQQLCAFIHAHPQALADHATRARLLEQLQISSIRPHELAGLTAFIDLLKPPDTPDTPDDSLARWHEAKSRLTGAAPTAFPAQ